MHEACQFLVRYRTCTRASAELTPMHSLNVCLRVTHEHAVHAHREHLNAEFLELGIFLRDRGDFCRSDECEVAWVEAELHPFSEEIGQSNTGKRAFVISRS